LGLDPGIHNSFAALAGALCKKYGIVESTSICHILELGSGAGSLAYHMRALCPSADIVTLDGNPETPEKSPYILRDHHFCVKTDEPYCISRDGIDPFKFDFILSFEHMEHIQLGVQLDKFVRNILDHSYDGTIFHGSAYKNVDGHPPHMNVQSKDWWIDYFTRLGWTHMPDELLFNQEVPFNIAPWSTSELIFVIKH
jgi:hypothetical protein